MGKTKGGVGKISSVKRNNKNVTKLEKQGKLNRKAGKRAGGAKAGRGGAKSSTDKKLVRLKQSDQAHRAALKARREEEKALGGGGGGEEDEESEEDEAVVSSKDLKDFGNASFNLLAG